MNSIPPFSKNRRHRLYPDAGYCQFYFKSDLEKADTASLWCSESFHNRLAIGPYVLGIMTDTYGPVPLDIELLDSAPDSIESGWDIVREGKLDITSGKLMLLGCPDPEVYASLSVPPGIYTVRIYSKLSPNPDDSVEYCGDSYLTQVWPLAPSMQTNSELPANSWVIETPFL